MNSPPRHAGSGVSPPAPGNGADDALQRLFDRQVQDRVLRQALAAAGGGGEGLADLERRLDLLVEATQKIHENLSLDLMLRRLVTLIGDAFHADRASLFLYDADTDELYARVAQGGLTKEIRFAADLGIAGAVFRSGVEAIVPDVYADSRFHRAVDLSTGYVTRNLMCVPVCTRRGDIIGVTEVLNRHDGHFSSTDAVFLRAFSTHVATAIENAQFAEQVKAATREQSRLMDLTRAISSELDIEQLLRKIIGIASELLDAERSTLFLHDPTRDELWSRVAEGIDTREIRIPSHVGIAGECFTRRTPIVIDEAYSDPRFNPAIDRTTGFRTRSILCVPVVNRHGLAVGVVQVLNRRSGSFSARDRQRLENLAAQSAIALENARLFHEAVEERNYHENVLRSLTNGVVTLDLAFNVVKINDTAARLLGVDPERVLGASALHLFGHENAWIRRLVRKAARSQQAERAVDATIHAPDGSTTAANVVASPLCAPDGRVFGFAVVIDDITTEMRLRTTMARYMTREVAEQVIAQGDSALGGRSQLVTILFADIANFTTLAERLGPQETVALLNEYFSEMVEVVFEHGGILDKYIGDALMAVYGAPLGAPRDADNAVRSAIRMQQKLALFNAGRAQRGEPPLDVRIGINSGLVIAGNIGSARRMDYTVVGDSVNLASRLESANKIYGTTILLSTSTAELLREDYALREIDWLRVRGRATPVVIHAVDAQPLPLALRERYAEGLAAYRRGDWTAATAAFDAVLAQSPDDAPSLAMRVRVADYRRAPPPSTWDGVYTLDEK
ncbi:MAG: adenylate/guanylate cyclase domain-containing protein [Gammaproteobacteria bacterium]